MINKIWNTFISDDNAITEDGTLEQAIYIANQHVNEHRDTYRNFGFRTEDYDKTCVKCVRNIFEEAKIPFPATNSVVTFMDAMSGYSVDMYDNPVDQNGVRQRSKFKHADKWDTILTPGDLQKGDVLIVHNDEGGYHATFVTDVSGEMSQNGLAQSFYTGVDIIHDKGAPTITSDRPVQRDHYEWYELNPADGSTGGNRNFVAAYRFTGGKNENSK
jgi:hypothetical protein